MALQAGNLRVTVEYAKGLKDADFFSKNDPYAVVRVGSQQMKTRTLNNAGTDPVWNETFTFQLINENTLEILIYDEDTIKDDLLGTVSIPLAKVREYKTDHTQAPVIRPKSRKQKGFVSVSLVFEPNSDLGKPQQQQAYPMGHAATAPAGYPAPQPAYGAPAPGYPAAPPAGYPPQGYPPQGYPPAAHAASYGAPPPGYPQAAPQGIPYGAPAQSYPGAYGAPPPGYPGAAPAYGSRPPTTVVVNPGRPQRPQQRPGMGGMLLAGGAGLLGGMLIGDMIGDICD